MSRKCWTSVVLLGMALLMGLSACRQEDATIWVEYENPVLGVQLEYPESWKLTEDQQRFPSYGFTLSAEEGALRLRVGWLHDASPEQIESLIARQIEGNPGLDIRRTSIEVAGHEGVKLSPLPGLEPVSCTYLVVEGRVYELWQRAEERTAQEEIVIETLRFETPQQSLPASP